ncbi:DUF4249 domain-containing protein [Mucilaginibacter rubeus]|uniref:DUF4249 domain-containing protein n=1 Tax=Mucilaginibacter rubeus TaxID=2027860 RepID=A0A5C1I6Y7_9SPHI|nr:DUF4249 domain-containing protein [Mucilaginibacter rubeus]QEM13765.1 DUF4249 domain-containing protein [Mucilaginibacter rubeus]
MKRFKRYIFYAALLMLFVWGCKKPYNPGIVGSPNHYLVIEGVINTGNDSTIIRLSKTVNISGNVNSMIIDNAVVSVEAEDGASYNLQSAGNGNYISTGLNLNTSKRYRLHINIDNSTEYASDYVVAKVNPPIDSIGFNIKNNQVNIYVNTHDATNNTRYYRWSFDETWRFHSKYLSTYIVDNSIHKIVFRTPAQLNYYCFAGDRSTSIVLSSSIKLSQDVIFQAPVTTIDATSEKIEKRYTILLKQYALTKEAYQFWENLKKNTEQLGSIFDAQPSQLTGNIHNLKDPKEPVIGYVSVTNIQVKRVFIDNLDLPWDWTAKYPYDCGPIDSNYFVDPHTMSNTVNSNIIFGGAIPVDPILIGGNLVGYTSSTVPCVDCTIRGVVKAPSFWKDR